MSTVDSKANNLFSIVKLTPEQAVSEAEKIVTIYRDVWLATYPNPQLGITREDLASRFQNLPRMIDDWKSTILNDNNRAVWVAKYSGQVVGFCVAKKEVNNNELEYIYILPEYQGMKLGQRLMNVALEWLGNEKTTVLYGAVYNDHAILFYKKYGFVLSTEHIPPKALPNGKSLPSMKMTKTASQ